MKIKTLKKSLAAFLAVICLPAGGLYVPAAEPAENPAQVSVTKNGDTLTIGNSYISREFSIADDKLTTVKITNKRTDGADTVFTPAEGSEEFKIRMAKEGDTQAPVVPAIDRSGWTATADSYQNADGPSDGNAPNLIDGNLDSIWHSAYNSNGTGRQEFPYNVLFSLGKSTTFQCFSYTPRQDGETKNGNLSEYELYYSASSSALEADSSDWQLLKKGRFSYDGVNPIYVNLDTPCTATQLKLKALSSNNGEKFAGGSEFNLHEQQATAATNDREFASGELILQGEPVIEPTSAVINDTEKTGQKVTFHFAPFKFKDISYTINEVVVMYDGDHFMRKYIEISVPDDKKSDAVIDYIDLESLNTNETDTVWTIPTDAGGIVQMERFKANLGQPIYIQGMFFGCEFPAADNEIADNTGYMRYYTGKSFERLEQDNQLTQDGKYVTWQTVAGAARSTDNSVIQADFFEYIKSIATPSEFRIQYNSWFDNMMLIDDANILESFIEIDRELNQAEVRPLDSYVVDDGWVNYNYTSVVDAARAGTTLNQTGFWEFNSKFPEGLTPSSELVHNFGSNFGVWVGPRGGYNFYGSLADILTNSKKGSKAGGSIDVADRTYVQNFTDMAVNWMKEYGVNYWKWDGFADTAQYNAFPSADGVPGYANRHMTGGYHNMYHVTDLWEAWIDLMEAVRQCEKENNIKNLWISLTCYVNPSPWYLQWANSVWIQCTADQADAGPSQSKMDRQITYRDACYYDFLENHEFQFPLSNIYNHDPVYGKEGTGMNLSTATDEQFKNYLYMLATRGTAFWELYFSDSIMTDGKYEIAGEFLEWAEENYHMLKNSKMFGGSPNSGTKLGGGNGGEQNAYGYACFDGTDGILSLRNSANTSKSVTINFDRTIGVPENAETLQYHIEHSHNLTAGTAAAGELTYGESYTFHLQPDEVRILRISKDGDTAAPKFARAYSDGGNEITVKFNEKVNAGAFFVNGEEVSVETGPDARTFRLTAQESSLADNSTVTVTAEGVQDLAGNALTENTISFRYHKDNLVADSAGPVTKQKILAEAKDSFTGNNGFTVSAEVYTVSDGVVLAQGEEYAVGIQEDGTAYFTLNGSTAVSKTRVNDGRGHVITGVKENNGMQKIYIDGQLEGAGYLPSNRYYEVKASDLAVGSDQFIGVVNAKILDASIGYDAVAEEFGKEPEIPSGEQNWALSKPVTAKWSADNSNAANNTADCPPSKAVDGTKTTLNYGEFGSDENSASSYLEVDLEGIRSISKINLYRYWSDGRTYNGTVIVLSETADFAQKEIVYNSDAENFHGLGAGTDAAYAETENGKSIELGEAVNARYVRVYMHGQGNSSTNHIVELEVLGTQSAGEADYASVDAAIAVANALEKADYKDFSKVEAAVAAVIRGKDAAAQNEVDAMAAAIFGEIKALEKTVRKELEKALEEAQKKILDGYTQESIAAYQKILSDAEAVLKNSSATAEEREAALAKVNAAKEVLITKETAEKETARKLLSAAITQAESYRDASKYTKESWDLFQKALTDAKSVFENAQSTKEEFDTAKNTLGAAIAALKSAPGPNKAEPVREGNIYSSGNYRYKVTSLSKQTVEVAGIVNPKLTKINISKTVTLEGKSYKITAIGASAFKNNKKATTAVLDKNIIKIGASAFEGCTKLTKVTAKSSSLTEIGSKAFSGCKKLKAITLRSKKLNKVGKNALKGIQKKATIKVPSAKLKAYKKLLAKKGQSKTVKIKK